MLRRKPRSGAGIWHEHGLSVAVASILLAWIVLYRISDEKTHLGSFFGNAIADWTGLFVTVVATKFLYEQGSAESKQDERPPRGRVLHFLREHSLTLFLVITGLGWVLVFSKSQSESKWGQVAGNIVSEWTQIFGIVLLTKRLVERGSKESR